MLELGAEEFVDLEQPAWEEAVGLVDLVFDAVGGTVLDRSAAVLRAGGTLVSISRPPTVRPDEGRAMYFIVEPDRGHLAQVVDRHRQGRLRPLVGSVRPLAEAPDAFRASPGRPGRPSSPSRDAARPSGAGVPPRRKAVTPMDLKLELIVLPVSDVDRAKAFYEALGFRLDLDKAASENWRAVHFTPPGSGARSSSARASRPCRRAPRRACTSSSPTSRRAVRNSSTAASR